MDIKNKEIRLELIARYLNAETSPAEEKMLMEYYGSNNHVDDDEQAFAKMIRMEKMNVSLLSEEGGFPAGSPSSYICRTVRVRRNLIKFLPLRCHGLPVRRPLRRPCRLSDRRPSE